MFLFFRDEVFFRFSKGSQQRWRTNCDSKKKLLRYINLVQGRWWIKAIFKLGPVLKGLC